MSYTALVEKKVDILTQCVLQVGAKTISHSFNAFAKYAYAHIPLYT